ncbi:MAG: hypothetical protein WC071_13635 [Victivallaceae bacterium]
MNHLKIMGGSIIWPADCEALFNGVRCNFSSPGDLKQKLSDNDWENGNWSNFRRFSPDAQIFTLGAGLALRDAGISFVPELTVGLLTADDFEHESDQTAYFVDYLEGGQTLGRSSLFVHTLPTSAAVDASVTLGLRGPVLYIRDEYDVWNELARTAGDFIANGDAEIMLLSYRSVDTLVCLVVSTGENAELCWPEQAAPDAIFAFARQQPKESR